MRKLLEADMKRVMSKIIPWLLLLAALIVMLVTYLNGVKDSVDRDFFFVQKIAGGIGLVELVLGFSALLGVYGDEFKSMVMIGVIGRGISRDKFVLAKFLDAVILIAEMIVITAIYVAILKAVFGINYTDSENRFMICMFVFAFIEGVAYVTIAAVFYFLSENAAVGLFAYLTFQLIIPLTLSVAVMFLPTLKRLGVNKWYVTGMVGSAYSDLILGDVGGAVLMIIPAVVIYIIAMLIATMFIFRKKELDF